MIFQNRKSCKKFQKIISELIEIDLVIQNIANSLYRTNQIVVVMIAKTNSNILEVLSLNKLCITESVDFASFLKRCIIFII